MYAAVLYRIACYAHRFIARDYSTIDKEAITTVKILK